MYCKYIGMLNVWFCLFWEVTLQSCWNSLWLYSTYPWWLWEPNQALVPGHVLLERRWLSWVAMWSNLLIYSGRHGWRWKELQHKKTKPVYSVQLLAKNTAAVSVSLGSEEHDVPQTGTLVGQHPSWLGLLSGVSLAALHCSLEATYWISLFRITDVMWCSMQAYKPWVQQHCAS